jgi:hypothetical protein
MFQVEAPNCLRQWESWVSACHIERPEVANAMIEALKISKVTPYDCVRRFYAQVIWRKSAQNPRIMADNVSPIRLGPTCGRPHMGV